MPHITRGAEFAAEIPLPGGHTAGLPRAVLRHLGGLLRGACAPGDPGRFATLLSSLDAAPADPREGEAAFRADLVRFMPNLRRFALSLTHDETAAEDVAQEALMRAWRARRSFEPGTNVQAWLLTIARNAFLSTLRKREREVADHDGERAAGLAVIPEQGGSVDLAEVRAAMDQLPAAMREALVLVAVGEASYEDAAARLGCRLGTVKSRVWRARRRLARALGYDGREIGADALMLAATSTGVQRGVAPLQ